LPTLRRALALLLLVGLSACAQLKPRPELPIETAVPAGEGTEVDGIIASAEARHPGASAFRLLREGTEAFALRARSARLAGRSLDVQTYIWHPDLTGAFLALRLVEAADRGVKVRLLVDDMDARSKNMGFAALAAHRNISVRMFNPFASRTGTMSLMGEGLTSFGRINHRMHNKTWIADNRLAIVGGRNLGDEYFGASDEVNFVDLDFAMIGPIVRDASASFDRYWNSPAAYPMELLDPAGVNAAALETLRTQLADGLKDVGTSRYADILRADDAVPLPAVAQGERDGFLDEAVLRECLRGQHEGIGVVEAHAAVEVVHGVGERGPVTLQPVECGMRRAGASRSLQKYRFVGPAWPDRDAARRRRFERVRHVQVVRP